MVPHFYIWSRPYPHESTSDPLTLSQRWKTAIDHAALAGYDGLEGELQTLRSNDDAWMIREALQARGLDIYATFITGNFHEEDRAEHTVETVVELAQRNTILRCPYVMVNPHSSADRVCKSKRQLAIQASFLTQLAQELRLLGQGLILHHHREELVDNQAEFRAMLTHIPPDLMTVCIDVHWAYLASSPIEELIDLTHHRLVCLHLRNSRNNVYLQAVESGDVDLQRIVGTLEKYSFSGWLTVELFYDRETQVTRSLPENGRQSINYLRSLISR